MPPRESGGSKTKSGAKKKAEEFQAKEKAKVEEPSSNKKGGKGAKGTKGSAGDEDGDPRLAAAAAKEKARSEELERKAKLRREADEETAKLAASSKKPKVIPKSKVPAGPGAIAAKANKQSQSDPLGVGNSEEGTIAVTGDYDALIEGAQAVLSSDTPDALRQQASLAVDKRSERRYHAAWEAYKERELPGMRQSHSGMTQHKHIDILHKQFQKSPENPKNALAVAYNATTEETVAALEAHRSRVEDSLKQK